MVEQITAQQKQNTEQALAICKDGQKQQLEQLAVDAQKKTEQTLKEATVKIEKTSRELAKMPENIMKKLKEIEDELWKIISGVESPDSLEWDGDKLIEKLNKMVDDMLKVFEPLKSLSINFDIPGLSDMKSLLEALQEMINMTPETVDKDLSKDKLNALVPDKPALPTHLLDTLKGLVEAIETICTTLPMVLLNAVCSLIDELTKFVKQIVEALKSIVPIKVPEVLKLPEELPGIGLQIKDFVVNAPGKINNVVKGTIKEKLQLIAALKHPEVPDPPTPLTVPEPLPACPQRS